MYKRQAQEGLNLAQKANAIGAVVSIATTLIGTIYAWSEACLLYTSQNREKILKQNKQRQNSRKCSVKSRHRNQTPPVSYTHLDVYKRQAVLLKYIKLKADSEDEKL